MTERFQLPYGASLPSHLLEPPKRRNYAAEPAQSADQPDPAATLSAPQDPCPQSLADSWLVRPITELGNAWVDWDAWETCWMRPPTRKR
jgi:hypothetical protein